MVFWPSPLEGSAGHIPAVLRDMTVPGVHGWTTKLRSVASMVRTVRVEGEIPWGPCRIAWPSVQPMYAAARRWRDEALVNDRSLFDGRRIDGVAAADELIAFYVNNPDLGSGTFASKLKAQLADASDDAIQVAAELLYVHTLVASTTTWSARSKAERNWSGVAG
jgi:hypothetical protein